MLAAVLVVGPAAAAEPSRAEDPNYDPDAAGTPSPAASSSGSSSSMPSAAQRTSTTPAASDQATPEEPYLEGPALRERVGDLVLTPWPPPLRVTVGFQGIYPYQPLGIGLGVEAYVARVVRLSALFSAGFALAADPLGGDLIFSAFGEASAGVRLFAAEGRIAAFVEPTSALQHSTEKPQPFKAWLPATHAMLLEGGMLTGSIPRGLCVANCEKEDVTERTYKTVNPQLFYLEAGLRYVFFSSASSQRQPLVDRRWQIEAFAHVVLPPFNDTKESVVSTTTWERMKRSPLGARAGFSIPICGHECVRVTAMGGYMPSPDTATLSLGIAY